VTRREGRRFVEEEQFREAARLHQRLAVPPTERESATDPALRRMVASDPTELVVEAPAVAVHEPARRVGDEFTQRRDPIAQGHRGTTVAMPTDVGA
jgi:hypothetical protein